MRAFDVERTSAISPGGPDGPVPVQPGDVVLIVVAKSWDEAAKVIKQIDPKRAVDG